MTEPQTNSLYYGDNLPILRGFPDEFVDLVYLDPPFNSKADYNAIFRDESDQRTIAQVKAFEDTWHWGPSAEEHFAYLTNTGMHKGHVPTEATAMIAAFVSSLGKNQMTAYLVEMTVRIVELHRVLKQTGSLYLHCDPTASHYLKIMLDAIFGAKRFLNEIVWCHYGGGQSKKWFPRKHDTILVYRKGEEWTFNADAVRVPYESEYRSTVFGKAGDPDRKVYLPNPLGKLPEDFWIMPRPYGKEVLGYPTQKPIALLERIIAASSIPGDIVLDPFCGCGTAVAAAQKLGRNWIGIDLTYLSIAVMKKRMQDHYPELGRINVVGAPTELEGARRLAADEENGRYQFQWWALDQIGATPHGGEKKKGADGGIDGIINFTEASGMESVIISVKSGGVQVKDIRELQAVVEREHAAIGVLVTLEDPSKPMRDEAAQAGSWHSELYDKDFPRIQIITAKEIIEQAKLPHLPPLVAAQYRKAARIKAGKGEQQTELFDQGGEAIGDSERSNG